jgi:hypothetical protein
MLWILLHLFVYGVNFDSYTCGEYQLRAWSLKLVLDWLPWWTYSTEVKAVPSLR